MANIKQIKVESTTFDIEALHFYQSSTLDTPAQWKQYIDEIGAAAGKIQIVIDSKSSSGDYPATAPSADTMGKIYLVQLETTETGTYTEFITVDTGTGGSHSYSWEKIGTTATDLSEYAKKGTYTSTGPSSDATGSAGGETVNTSETDLGTATGTIKIDKHSISISAHSHGVNASTTSVGSASGWSAGTAPSRASFTYATGAFSTTVSALTGVKASGTTAVNTDAIKDITLTASTTTTDGPAFIEDGTKKYMKVTGTAASTGQVGISSTPASVSTNNYGFNATTNNVMYGPTVTSGVLSWSVKNAGTTVAVTGGSASLTGTTVFNTDAVKAVSLTASSTSTDGPEYIQSVSKKYMKHTNTGASTTSVVTGVTSDGTATVPTSLVTGSAWQITGVGTTPSLTITPTTVMTGATLDTAGSTSITLTHTQTGASSSDYNTLNTSVAIGKHKHSVTTSNHTHTLGNHTHNTTI